MREQLEQFLAVEKLSKAQLAEMLDVPPSTISHILAGRNKPGYEIIRRLLVQFPRINPRFLICGTPPMFTDEGLPGTESEVQKEIAFEWAPDPVDEAPDLSVRSVRKKQPDHPSAREEARDQSPVQVERVVVFYSDRTFVAYEPR